MAISYRVFPEIKMVIFVHEGHVPDEEFLSFYRTFHADPKFLEYGKYLVDLRRADSASRSPQALLDLAGWLRQHYENPATEMNIAVVAPKSRSFNLARLYEVFSCAFPWHFEVFGEMVPALHWLDVPQDLVEDFIEA